MSHFKLGHSLDRCILRIAGWTMQRDVFIYSLVRDHDASGMRTHIAHHAFHVLGSVNQFFQIRRTIIQLAQFVDGCQCFSNTGRFTPNCGDHLTDLINLTQWNIHHPSHIPDRRLGTQCTKGDDSCNFIVSILICTILDHAGAFVILKVQINIWHGNTAGVQETFKDQTMV